MIAMADTTTVSRRRASELTGLAVGTLRNLACQHRGPRPLKITPTRQGRTLYRLTDIAAWQADPARYERRAWKGVARAR
jgi:hypothetical protein